METDEPGLVRYWFEFDLAGHRPDVPAGQIQLDGGTAAYRLLGRGAGVTGYDKADCLNMLSDALGDELPPLARADSSPVVDRRLAIEVGNTAWRGVWFPPLNLRGPRVG